MSLFNIHFCSCTIQTNSYCLQELRVGVETEKATKYVCNYWQETGSNREPNVQISTGTDAHCGLSSCTQIISPHGNVILFCSAPGLLKQDGSLLQWPPVLTECVCNCLPVCLQMLGVNKPVYLTVCVPLCLHVYLLRVIRASVECVLCSARFTHPPCQHG